MERPGRSGEDGAFRVHGNESYQENFRTVLLDALETTLLELELTACEMHVDDRRAGAQT